MVETVCARRPANHGHAAYVHSSKARIIAGICSCPDPAQGLLDGRANPI